MRKPVSELKLLTKLARTRGKLVMGGPNGGGWANLARACGFQGFPTKQEAKDFVREKLATVAPSPVIDKTPRKAPKFVQTDAFLSSFEWRRVRMLALKKYGPRCQCCGATPKDGAVMNVDHIKPRKLWPSLALDVENLQVLCHECNHGKGNWDMTDWRENADVLR